MQCNFMGQKIKEMATHKRLCELQINFDVNVVPFSNFRTFILKFGLVKNNYFFFLFLSSNFPREKIHFWENVAGKLLSSYRFFGYWICN